MSDTIDREAAAADAIQMLEAAIERIQAGDYIGIVCVFVDAHGVDSVQHVHQVAEEQVAEELQCILADLDDEPGTMPAILQNAAGSSLPS